MLSKAESKQIQDDIAKLENAVGLLLVHCAMFSHDDKVAMLNVIDNILNPSPKIGKFIQQVLVKPCKYPRGETSPITGVKTP